MTSPYWMVLVPTELERRALLPHWGPHLPALQLAGFGPIAAAAQTTRALVETPMHPVDRVLLIGIAGSFDLERWPLGTAHTFDEVVLDHFGVGYGRDSKTSIELGFAQLDGPDPLFERARLDTLDHGAGLLVTTPVASAHAAEAAERRARYINPLAEDMEGFGVALACHMLKTPLTIVRGASNTVGDRDASRWQIQTALQAAAALAETILTTP